MEFIDMAKYMPVAAGAHILPYRELRALKPIYVTYDLKLHDDPENLRYTREMAAKGMAVMPVRRLLAPGGVTDGSFPQRVLLELTTVCNTNCRMCPRNIMKRPHKHLETEKIKEILDELDRHGLHSLLLFFLGESMTHPDFFEILDYAGKKKNLGTLWLSSNGILMTRDIVEKLLASQLTVFQLSLQSLSKEGYTAIAPDTPYDTVMKNLDIAVELKKDLLGQKPFFRIQSIDQASNQHELDDFLVEYHDKCDLISVDQVEYQSIDFNRSANRIIQDREKKKCSRIANGDCLIQSDGGVSICDEAVNNEFCIGSMYEDTLENIWQSAAHREIVRQHKCGELWSNPLCRECQDFDFG